MDVMEREAARLVPIEAHDYHRVFAFNPHPMWVFDLETLELLDVNEAAVNHYGYSRREFLRMTLPDLRPADDLPRLYRHLPTTRDNPVPPITLWRHVKKDGSRIDVEISSFRVGFGGRPAKIVMADDVTARKGTADIGQFLRFLLVGLRELSQAQSLSAARDRAAVLRDHVMEALVGLKRFVDVSSGAGGEQPPTEASTGAKRLSGRELEVLERIAQGHTNREVAEELGLSIKSVEAYRARLLSKLGLRSRAELVSYSLERGLLRPGKSSSVR